MVGASKRFTAESGNKNRNAKRNRSGAQRIGGHFLYGMSGDLVLEFVGRADCEGLHLMGSNRLTSPDGELRCWCVCLGMGGRPRALRAGRGPQTWFSRWPADPSSASPPVDRWVPPMSCSHPAVAAVPCLFDGDLGCPLQTGEAFYQSTSNLEDLTSASLPSCATRDVTPMQLNHLDPACVRHGILSMYFLHRHNASHGI